MQRIFILSPANSGGERAKLIYNERAQFPLATRLRSEEGVPLGEVFSFLSGLYFRGKFTYAKTFAQPPETVPGVLVITPNRGILPADVRVTLEDLHSFSKVPVDPRDARYAGPLERDAKILAQAIGRHCETVLLGSIGTQKYAGILLRHLEERLKFPSDFVGRGDMSRGGLLLRSVAEQRELPYVPVAGAVRRGKRPAKLQPKTWGYRILSGETKIQHGD
jgi:hypothetical protein